jgi:hypothetical protein
VHRTERPTGFITGAKRIGSGTQASARCLTAASPMKSPAKMRSADCDSSAPFASLAVVAQLDLRREGRVQVRLSDFPSERKAPSLGLSSSSMMMAIWLIGAISSSRSSASYSSSPRSLSGGYTLQLWISET